MAILKCMVCWVWVRSRGNREWGVGCGCGRCAIPPHARGRLPCEWDAEAVDVATTAVPTSDGVLVGEALAAEVGFTT